MELIYILDLPSTIRDNYQLEQTIRRRLDDAFDIKINNIKCYSKLGIGVIETKDSQVRKRLFSIGRLSLDPKQKQCDITFSDSIELVSYVVLNITKEMKDLDLPTTKEVARRWYDLHDDDQPLSCEIVDAHFPNVFRIISTSLDKLLANSDNGDMKIKKILGQCYYYADCSFFEDLPESITHDQIRKEISRSIDKSDIPSSSLRIEINKRAAVACIIATDTARQWNSTSFIRVNQHILSRKKQLAYRLELHPIPQGFSIPKIISNPKFNDTVVNHKLIDESLIVELSDRDIFQQCLHQGALRIDREIVVHIDLPVKSTSFDETDESTHSNSPFKIIAKYEPDIMQYIINPKHPIFKYKWDSQAWLQHFSQVSTQKRDDSRKIVHDPKSPTPDRQRHQLRVLVMLDTLNTIRKRTYTLNKREINLNLKRQLQTIVYDHESILEKSPQIKSIQPSYEKTTVRVVNRDCLVEYENMLKHGRKPVVLNMASASSPGGGYRKGDGAQEETLFRRSDYCRSLDSELDRFFEQQQERSYCSSTGELKSFSTQKNSMYPMKDYGAIYTSGITVFRREETSGYEYMEEPIEDVCAIAMAAYYNPELKNNMLVPKLAADTRKKIENIFAIAHQHKHDCLILSAFGCGAYKNPPSHIVSLFQSVIVQYVGFFKDIVFAIVDDHNAGRQLNPDGNFQPFFDILNGMTVTSRPISPIANVMFGSYRFSTDSSTICDVCIFSNPPCQYGAKCTQMNDQTHANQYSHPPICIDIAQNRKCKYANDVVHATSFIHRIACRNGGECEHIDDEKHRSEYIHPEYCTDGGKCQRQDDEHLKQFRHLPLCTRAQSCLEYIKDNNNAHCKQFRHCLPRCQHGYNCAGFYNQKHVSEQQHPFATPCLRTPFDCSAYFEITQTRNIRRLPTELQQHGLEFAHVCRYGRTCRDKTSLHWSKSIHIGRYMCSNDKKCTRLTDEEHLNSFTHTDVPDIRIPCRDSLKCRDRQNIEHVRFYQHPTFDLTGVVKYYGSNDKIDFVENQKKNTDTIKAFMKTNSWPSISLKDIPNEILKWFRQVQPVHRCSPEIFESIVLHGHVMSREFMHKLTRRKFVVDSILQHSQLQHIKALNRKDTKEDIKQFVTALVDLEFQKHGLLADTSYTNDEHKDYVTKKETKISMMITSEELTALRTKSTEVAEASIKLQKNPSGIGYDKDKCLGTDRLVFSILGPHYGHYYGDVIIVFKREILHHPDTNFTMQAATSFASASSYRCRPWLGADPGAEDQRVKHFHETKLHAAVQGYEYVAALELMLITATHKSSKILDTKIEDILNELARMDSHRNIEAHLPQLIPLDCIDHVYIPKNLHDNLAAITRKAMTEVLAGRVTVVPHDGIANQDRSVTGPVPAIASRAEFQNFAMKRIREQYRQNIRSPSSKIAEGFIITLPAMLFDDHYALPLTIQQAYAQYRLQHSHTTKSDTVYIYWKASFGEMMLTLTDSPIDFNDKTSGLRSLICYLAPVSSLNNNHEYRQISYIASGHPYEHTKIMHHKSYKVKSNNFYAACHTNDVYTYCLEIHRSNGKVVLYHAGPNGIYNHERMSYTFKQTECELNKLDYIHLSSGNDSVSIRNLKICFQKEVDLHPSFDDEFKAILCQADEKPKVDESSAFASSKHSVKSDDHPSAEDSTPRGAGVVDKLMKLVFGDNDSPKKPCPYGPECRFQHTEDSNKHNAEYSHLPPRIKNTNSTKSVCKFGAGCYDNSEDHRATFSHPSAPKSRTEVDELKIPCRFGPACHDSNPDHLRKYSHPSILKAGDSKIPCRFGPACHDRNPDHLRKYSHPSK